MEALPLAVPPDLQSLSPEARALLLDVGQFTLDVIGIVEPTPFADLTSGVVSLIRSDWHGALISGAGVLPYVGDVAKLAKIPRYVNTVERSIQLAKTDAKFASMLRPLLTRLLSAIDRLPVERLAPVMRESLDRMRRKIDDFLGGLRVLSPLDRLTDDVLRRVFGSTKNVGVLPRRNVRTIVEFFDKHNVGSRNPAEWAELLKGIDLHAVEAVTVLRFKPGEMVAQYVETSRAANRQVGQWMVLARGAVSHRNIGLSAAGRQRKMYRVTHEVEVLRSKAAPAADHWTGAGAKPHTAVTVVNGQRTMKAAEQVGGGGDQYFLPQAWQFLQEVPAPK
jgi:hypothetical protein